MEQLEYNLLFEPPDGFTRVIEGYPIVNGGVILGRCGGAKVGQ